MNLLSMLFKTHIQVFKQRGKMKTKTFLAAIVIFALVLALVPVAGVSAAVTKVAVCHVDELGVYHLINISDTAFPAHVAHGDASPSDWVPGQPGNKFEADCSITSVPKYTFVETMTIPSKPANSVISSSALILGQAYQLRASGTYKYSTATGWDADAKCSNRFPPYNPLGNYVGWVDGALLGTTYGLQVGFFDGNTLPPLTPVGWVEACNTAHTYTATYAGTGTPIQLFIWDDYYGDNSGSITVDIYKINW